MGDRHGGRFARRGRALSPPRRDFPTARCGFPMARGGGQDLPRAGTRPSAKAYRHGARAKGLAPRRNTPLGEGLPTRRTGERICPAQKHSPRRKHPNTAHERKDLPHAGTLPTAKASRHGARAKGLPRAGTLPRRKPPDTARRRRDLPHAGTLSSAKASRHGARSKEFARAETLPSAKASRHGTKAKGFAPQGFALAPRADERRAALGPQTAEKHPFGGVAPETARPLPSSFTEKK